MSGQYLISKETLLLMADYNIWATQQLGVYLKNVVKDDLYRDAGLFFNSIFGTLNHLLAGEHYIWYVRFAQNISPQTKLNTTIETDHVRLLAQLESKSKNWIELIERLDDVTLNGNLNYQTTTGQQKCLPYAATLLHVFNHGTHHRAQVTAALTAMGYECPVLDLVYMLVERHS
ncbi:DinB family protein [Acinetobacter ihumii]|uniref:DinB family protein n=1 Tax=Acinetobacter ihumii TaxID=2483802 RepID=UPI00102F9176|nr:DinB family protein [Acinetobacter ihumii]